MYGVVMKCSEGCEHLVSVGRTYMDAWGNVPKKLIGLTAEKGVCRTIRLRKEEVEAMRETMRKIKNIGGLHDSSRT